MSEGWVKLHRKIWDWVYAGDPEYLSVWVWLLTKATHRERKRSFNGDVILLKPGQLITGRDAISAQTKISVSKVQRILKRLEIEHQIEQLTTPKGRLISITYWQQYQASEQPNEQLVNSQRTAGEQLVNTNKNVKNNKKEKNVKKTNTSPAAHSSAQDDLFAQFWNAYPVKKDKGRCRKIWAKIKPDQFMTNDIVSAIENQKGERMVLEDRNEFVPCWKNPSTWLNGQCWEDEPSEKAVEIQKDNDLIEKFLNGEKPDNVILGDFKW